MKPCRTCQNRWYWHWQSEGRQKINRCFWVCGHTKKLIGEGTDECLQKAKGCQNWIDQNQVEK